MIEVMNSASLLTDPDRAALAALLERHAGLRLSGDQSRSLDNLVMRLLETHRVRDARALLQILQTPVGLVLLDELAEDLTIGETHFFRVAPQIEALRHTILPDLVRLRMGERRVAVWSAGCSTGEEPYTLAILLREHLPAPDSWDIRLLATDINHEALEQAKQARYRSWSFRDTPEALRERYFSPEPDNTWRLATTIRHMVEFTRLNMAADAPPCPNGSGFDLIVCRNVTIYFSPEAAQRLYRRFVTSLRPGGWLLLGPSDPPPDASLALETVYAHDAIAWRGKETPAATRDPQPVRPSAQQRRPPGYLRQPEGRLVALPTRRDRRHVEVAERAQPAVMHAMPVQSAREQAEADAARRPLDAGAHQTLGMLYLDAGEIPQAIESLRRATFLDAANPLAQFSLGHAYREAGEPGRARAALIYARRLLAPRPDEEPVAGAEHLLVGDLRQAVEAQLAALAGSDPR